MKVILNQDVPNLGEEGDVCLVKDGYGRNFLLPSGAAVIYNNANVAIFKSRAAAIEKRKIAKRHASAELKTQLDKVTLTLVIAAGETGKLFGSVTPMMIQEELKKLGFDIEKKRIEFAAHSIKTTGTYDARIHLYENAVSEIKIVVKSEADVKAEAEAAAKAAEEAAKAAEDAAKAAEEPAKVEEAPAAEKAEN